MVRVTLAGPELAGFPVPEPAASVRLLIPSSGRSELVMPEWNGNEFLLPDGQRPTIRTFTPRFYRPDDLELDLDIVLHEGGATSAWATAASPGDPAAISGPGRGWEMDLAASRFLLAGDETAIPAIAQLLESLPGDRPVAVLIETAHPDERLALPDHPEATIEWLDRPEDSPPGAVLVPAIRDISIDEGARLWVAGEAAAMHRVRQFLFKEIGVPRSRATVRGYWKLRD
ncbi:MAG: siderophore-interacting protein [Acidimicrobiia bacterium]|nr:siderophore-interacting protein [Acidimicrobiia bacterium]